MKKRHVLMISLMMLALAGCGESGSKNAAGTKKEEGKTEQQTEAKTLSKEEFNKMFSEPKKYKGATVDFYGKVFVEPEKDTEGTYLQVFANNNSDRNVIVAIKDPDLEVTTDDILHIKGTVKDVFEGENAFGGTISAPTVVATTVEKSDYQTAFAPAKATIEVNQEQNQHGYKLTVSKVELAEKETRVYVKVSNEATSTLNFYTHNAKLVSGGKQYEKVMNFDADYPELQSEILPSVSSEGIISFPAIPDATTEFQLFLEGSSDNYELRLNPFVFKVQKQ